LEITAQSASIPQPVDIAAAFVAQVKLSAIKHLSWERPYFVTER
jgi:hypothetical protein